MGMWSGCLRGLLPGVVPRACSKVIPVFYLVAKLCQVKGRVFQEYHISKIQFALTEHATVDMYMF